MGKGPGLYSDIGKKARDLLYRDYQTDHKFTITTYSPTGVAITSTGLKKGDQFLTELKTQLETKKFATDIRIDTYSNVFATVTVDEAAPGLKTIFSCRFPDLSSARIPDKKSAKMELQYFHDYAGICTSVGLTTNPIVNFSGVLETNVLSLGTDVSFGTKVGAITNCNAGLSFTNEDPITSLNL